MPRPDLTPAERQMFLADVAELDHAEQHTCQGDPDCQLCFLSLVSRSSIGAGIRDLLEGRWPDA